MQLLVAGFHEMHAVFFQFSMYRSVLSCTAPALASAASPQTEAEGQNDPFDTHKI